MKIRKYRDFHDQHLDYAYVRDAPWVRAFWYVPECPSNRKIFGVIVAVPGGWQMTTAHPHNAATAPKYGPIFDTPEACALWWEMQT